MLYAFGLIPAGYDHNGIYKSNLMNPKVFISKRSMLDSKILCSQHNLFLNRSSGSKISLVTCSSEEHPSSTCWWPGGRGSDSLLLSHRVPSPPHSVVQGQHVCVPSWLEGGGGGLQYGGVSGQASHTLLLTKVVSYIFDHIAIIAPTGRYMFYA